MITWARFKQRKSAVFGLVAFGVIAFCSIFASFIAPYGMNEYHVDDRMQPPSTKYWFGTDRFGRDLFTRVLYGGRTSLAVGAAAVVGATLTGTVLGIASGYFGGVVDNTFMRFTEVFMTFPGLLLTIIIVAIIGPGLYKVVIAMTISGMPGIARIVRGAVLSVKHSEYVEAARAVGAKDMRIIKRSIIPNILGTILVLFTLDFGAYILSASGLSYLGLGAQPPRAEWGLLLSDAQSYLGVAWWLAVFPGAVISLTVLSINLVGDTLRDLVDPRLKQ